MRRKWQIFVVLLTWCVGTGSQWDLVQAFAWGRMFAEYSRTMPCGDAFKSTLYGRPCDLCLLVARARTKETPKSTEAKSSAEKAILLIVTADPVPDVPVTAQVYPRVTAITGVSFLTEPPTPPPRHALV